jgi:glycine betaine/proline transport system permease protein
MADSPQYRPSEWLGNLPVDDWVQDFVRHWLIPNYRPLFQKIKLPIDWVMNGINDLLLATPFLALLILFGFLALRYAGRLTALFTVLALVAVEMMGVWEETMTTLAMVLTSVLFCAVIGIPLGVAAARWPIFDRILRPILDLMQTTPAFVYLVPVVMLFGVGLVPGVIATIIFALPPLVRLTTLGIRQVPGEIVEAGRAFGAKPLQMLFDIQLPLAWPSIMAGLNQTLMMSLSMVVIAALIGAGGLGLLVFQGIGRLDIGAATVGGLGIVLLAIILDRITQGMGQLDKTPSPWDPVEFLKRLFLLNKQHTADTEAEESGVTEKA